jgi:hypothetical protein
MWVIKMVLQSFALFALPIVILTLFNMLTMGKNRAVGMGVIRAYGPFFTLVGLFYVAFGLFLWSPLPATLFRHLLKLKGVDLG